MIATALQALVLASSRTPLDPPEEFAATLELRRKPESKGAGISECPMCQCEMLECDCQWSAQG